jgi:hypothetical protein
LKRTRGGRESARKIFEMGARSGQRNTRLYSEDRVAKLEEIPKYLGKESAKERKMMVRFRCGNEERKNRYCAEGEERRCYEERETIEHCVEWM